MRDDGAAMGYDCVIELWRGADDAFRRFFVEALRGCPFACFRFETPPLSLATVGRVFEFVLVDSPEIDLAPDPGDFRTHFDTREDDVVVFGNLGGDATLVAPRPDPGLPGYAHLAGFVRHAPLTRQLELWRAVGEALHRCLGVSPLWLNTAGGGVPWLHVRLDSRPKYYVFDAYRRAAAP